MKNTEWSKLTGPIEAWVLRDQSGIVLATIEKYRPDSIVWEWRTYHTTDDASKGVVVCPSLEAVQERVWGKLVDAGLLG